MKYGEAWWEVGGHYNNLLLVVVGVGVGVGCYGDERISHGIAVTLSQRLSAQCV